MLTSMLFFALTAQAATPDDWKGTRWQLSVESVLPMEVDLLAKTNEEFILKALQLRTVVACNQAEPAGKGLVVTCDFEDAAIQAIPHGESPSERELENSQIVIDDVVSRMKGAQLEVMFNKNGKITRVDVLGIEGDNLREKNARERIRQLSTDLAMGWSFKAPKELAGTFQESNSPIFRAPGVPSAGGTNLIAHSGATKDGKTIVQSQGSGIALVPNTPWEFASGSKVAGSRAQDQAVEGGGSNLSGQGAVGGTRMQSGTVRGGATAVGTTPETRNYDVSLRGVAVVDDASGMIEERVWSVAGAGTPSTVGSFQGVSLWYSGHLRKLGADEKPDLGPTRMVHPPGVVLEGLPAWEPMGQ